MEYYLKIALFGVLANSCYSWREPPPRVKIRQGIIEGMIFRAEKRLKIFYGIPYAAPPVGPLRFSPPTMHQGWNGTYQAFNTKSRCPQLPIKDNENEDCLYLDIWMPEVNNSTRQSSVVVFFGGVDFARDSKLIFSGQNLASRGIIVVRVSYRLNIFGFLSLGTQEFRGNIGLLDQYYALLWVKENIANFGGDNQNITLFGHYSGATSVSLHTVSPRTQGLFKRVFISSGSAVSPWIIDNETIENSRQIIRILKCDSYTLSCLRRKSVTELLQAFQIYSETVNRSDILLPIPDVYLPIDDRYLPTSVSDSFRSGIYHQIPTLIGTGFTVNSPEIDNWIKLLSQGYFFLQKYVEKVKIPEILQLYQLNEKMQDLITKLVEWQYSLFVDTDGRFLIDQLKKMEYEAKIEAPVFLQILYMSQNSNVSTYVYSIQHTDYYSDIADESITMDMVLLLGPNIVRQISKKRFNSKDNLLSEKMQEYVANFITFGHPTPNEKTPWRKYVLHDPYVREIKEHSFVDNDRHQRKRILFWNDLLKKFSDIRYNVFQPSISVELSNVGSAAGLRNIILCSLLVFLLVLLIICIILLRRKSRIMRTNSSWTVG